MKKNSSKAIFSTSIVAEAGELADRMAAIWNARATEPGEHYTREDVFTDAIAHGLHLLALRDTGDVNAWDPDHAIGVGHVRA